MKLLHKLLFAIALLMMACGIWFALGKPWPKSGSNDDSEPYRAEATRRSIESELTLTGEVAPAFQVDVKPEVGGKVKEIHAIAGQQVKRGDLLVVIDDSDLLTEKASAETEIRGAELEVDKKKGNYERAQQLFESKLISKEVFANLESDLLIAKNSLQKAESRMRTVEDKLRKTRILAPSDGTILDVYVNPGQVVVGAASVNSGTSLMNFADLSKLLINSHVNQMDYSKVSPGAAAEVLMADDVENPVRAQVDFIAPVATVKSSIKGFEIQATVQDPANRLKPGMSVSMTVVLGKADNSVTVPIAAVFGDGGDRVVYVRNGTNVEKRRVSVGITNLSFAEITAGLAEGEEILLVEPRTAGGKS